jgi:hypothetical protein
MTLEEASAQRAARLAEVQVRAARIGFRVEEDPRGAGFYLLGPGHTPTRGYELGLPQIEDCLAIFEAGSPITETINLKD